MEVSGNIHCAYLHQGSTCCAAENAKPYDAWENHGLLEFAMGCPTRIGDLLCIPGQRETIQFLILLSGCKLGGTHITEKGGRGSGLADPTLSLFSHAWQCCLPQPTLSHAQLGQIPKAAAIITCKDQATDTILKKGEDVTCNFLLNICLFDLRFLLLLWCLVMDWVSNGSNFFFFF